MRKPVDSLYICPWSLSDPLCQSQSLPYLRSLTRKGIRFALITFESDRFAMLPRMRDEWRARLKSEGIRWYPLHWNSGKRLSEKATSLLSAYTLGAKVCLATRPRLIHSRSSLPAFLAVPLAKLFRKPYLYDADSLLSEEYLDSGYFDRYSRSFRWLAASERRARASAAQIIVLTQRLKNRYENEFSVDVPIEVIPCCIDLANYRYDATQRTAIRSELKLTNERLYVYVGKIGSWYMVEETIDFFAGAVARDDDARLLIVTQDAHDKFEAILQARGIPQSVWKIRSASPAEVPAYLSAADVGLALIRSLPSKKGSSPIKVSEYLACGLPVVTTDGIGDLTPIVENERCGVVLRSIDSEGFRLAQEGIEELLRRESLKRHCRDVAERHFDLENVGVARYLKVYGRLLSAEPTPTELVRSPLGD